jgi:hypothetical protein
VVLENVLCLGENLNLDVSEKKALRKFDVHRSAHPIPIVKPVRCTSFSIYLILHNTLHVSDGLFVHHQEFKTVRTATGTCQTDTATCLLAGTRWNAKQAKETYQYRNIKGKLYRTNAAIWCNKTCREK